MTSLPRRSFLKALLALAPVALLPTTAKPAPAHVAPTPAPLLPPPDAAPFDLAALERWKHARRLPLTASDDPLAARLLRAAARRQPLDVIYYGGSFPGTIRTLTPRTLFTVEGYRGVFMEAHCAWRREMRTFNLDRLSFKPLRLE